MPVFQGGMRAFDSMPVFDVQHSAPLTAATADGPALLRSIHLRRSALEDRLLREAEHGAVAAGLRGALVKLRTPRHSGDGAGYVVCEIAEVDGPCLARTVHVRGPLARLPLGIGVARGGPGPAASKACEHRWTVSAVRAAIPSASSGSATSPRWLASLPSGMGAMARG